MRTTLTRLMAILTLTVCGTPLSVSAQALPPTQAQAPQVRRLTVDEAVNLYAEIPAIVPVNGPARAISQIRVPPTPSANPTLVL